MSEPMIEPRKVRYCYLCPPNADRWVPSTEHRNVWLTEEGLGRVVFCSSGSKDLWFATLAQPEGFPTWCGEFDTLEEAQVALVTQRRRLAGCVMIDEHHTGYEANRSPDA